MQEPGTGLVTSRVSRACDRCHRQKLKCDSFRPCTLCTRSGATCVTTPSQKTTAAPKRKRIRVADDDDGVKPIIARPPAQDSPTTKFAADGERPFLSSITTPATCTSSVEDQDFGASTSSIEFARNVFGRQSGLDVTGTSLIPGHEGETPTHNQLWRLHFMTLPPDPVMQVLIDTYFDGVHWFICLFHEESFRDLARRVLRASKWSRRDLSEVVVVMTVALMGLRTGLEADSWIGYEVFQSFGLDPQRLQHELVSEIKLHILDVVDDCGIEAIQACLLYSTFHVYYGSPSLSWSLLGMGVRVAYGLGIHSSRSTADDFITQQVRSRCWNHTIVGDTFASMIYGRPASLDATFADVHELAEIDQSITDPSVLNHPIYGQGNPPTTVTFNVLKTKTYRIIRHALDRFRVLRYNDQTSEHQLRATIETSQSIHRMLTELRSGFHPLFEWENWKLSDPWKLCESSPGTTSNRGSWRALLLQATVLQFLSNGAVILAHRPLLEHKMSSEYSSPPSKFVLDAVRSSLDAAVKAALIISQIPIQRIDGQSSIGFLFMHMFTAGVILCMPPTSQPLSPLAQEAKAGVIRIIRACRDMSSKNRIAQHTEKILSELLKVTLQREVENALKQSGNDELSGLPNYASRPSSNPNLLSRPNREPGRNKETGRISVPPTQSEGSSASGSNITSADASTTEPAIVETSLLGVDPMSDNGMPLPMSTTAGDLWPFRGYDEMNVHLDGFQDMMFNLLPNENGSSFPSDYQYNQ